ncbi:Conserved_hypothetical protein [Hexamita inflata]|uniref:Uncharacterized protein n=1 Tax=Hexamita inflata TaxID=28002 RepID=A0ABP1LRS2_9EUKA
MSFTITPGLLNSLLIEIDLLQESQNEKKQWSYMFSWGQAKPQEIKTDAKDTNLLLEARIGFQQQAGLIGFLKQKLSQFNSQPQDQNQKLEIAEQQQISQHTRPHSRMEFEISLDNERQKFLQIRYDENNVTVDGLGYKTELITDGMRFVQGIAFVGYVGVARTRLRVLCKFLVLKSKLREEMQRGTNFLTYQSLPIPFHSYQQLSMQRKQNPSRQHPLLDMSLQCPIIISSKLLMKKNVFTVGGSVHLQRIFGQPNTNYVCEIQTFLNAPFNSVDAPVTFEKDQQSVLISKKLSPVVRSNKYGTLSFNFTAFDIMSEVGGLFSDKPILISPVEVIVKLFQLTAQNQLIYVGFGSVLLPVTPGSTTVKNQFTIPSKNRLNTEKTYFFHSTFGHVPQFEQRTHFGLKTDNQIFNFECQINVFHFLESEEGKKMQEKAAGFGSMLGKLQGAGGGFAALMGQKLGVSAENAVQNENVKPKEIEKPTTNKMNLSGLGGMKINKLNIPKLNQPTEGQKPDTEKISVKSSASQEKLQLQPKKLTIPKLNMPDIPKQPKEEPTREQVPVQEPVQAPVKMPLKLDLNKLKSLSGLKK